MQLKILQLFHAAFLEGCWAAGLLGCWSMLAVAKSQARAASNFPWHDAKKHHERVPDDNS
jgi:hypothetical protein